MELDFSLFSLANLLILSLGIYALMYCVRRIVETLWKSAPTNRYWRDLALPVIPIAIGVLIGWIAVQYPWPETLTSLSARLMLGGVCGLASSFVYGRFKAWLKSAKSIVPGAEEPKDETLP